MDKQPILCRTFRDLHERGCFILPNPWDIGSARVLEQLGFKALATTSAGFAWSMGHADDQVSVEMTLDHLRAISQAVDVPINALLSARELSFVHVGKHSLLQVTPPKPAFVPRIRPQRVRHNGYARAL